MTNNTTSYGGDFTIKPLTTSIDIITERQLLASWTRAGLSDSQIIKMLKLYFGEPAWMNIDKVYDCNMFGQIAKGLKFHNRHDFVELIIRCKGFGFIWMNDKERHTDRNLLAFYTPTWHEPKVEEMNSEDFHAENGKVLSGNEQVSFRYYDNNIYNKKKNIKKKNISPYTSGSQLAQVGNLTAEQTTGQAAGKAAGQTAAQTAMQASAPSRQNLAEYQQLVETTAWDLLAYVRTNPDAYAKVVKPVNDATEKMMVGLYSDPDAACPTNIATNQFFNSYLYPYLLNNSNRMMSIHTIEGQSCWLKNLINQDFMQKKILQAIADTKVYLAQHPGEMIRQNRPFSKFEYQDPESKQRFYDTLLPDGSIAQHRIPLDAPPRPSDQATWSKFTHEWKTEKAGNTEKDAEDG